MTISNILASTVKDGYSITVYESWEKFSRTPRYQIVIAKESIAIAVIPTARTTWKKKFKQMAGI